MKTFKERAEELALSCKRVKNNNVYETLAKEFSIGKRTAGDRFKSLFGMPIRDFISKNITPSKEVIIDCIIKTENWNDFYNLTGTNDSVRLSKLMKEYFGNSSYFHVKNNLLAKMPIKNYNPVREDNESILISQILGDGSVERDSCIKIEHGYKQYEYLKFKIQLLNTAYPETNGLEHIRTRYQNTKNINNYVSYTYRTGQVLKKQITKLQSHTLEEMVNLMTPLGVMLYFLDDGYFAKAKNFNTWELGFATINTELQDCLMKYFKTYGYDFKHDFKSVKISSKPVVIKFINDFIRPFAHIIPECLHYKFDLKDIAESCKLI